MGRVLLGAVVSLVVAMATPALASADGFAAGAARIDTTPPRFDAAQDAKTFGLCSLTGLFSGPRRFLFQEPYADVDGSGFFNYPEPFCDLNLNGRYDGIYLSGGVGALAERVHDPIDARAIALSDGSRTATGRYRATVVVSVVAQGIFQNYTQQMRDKATALRPGITGMIVSSNHNESSPDTVGIYGAPDTDQGFGLTSGIDEYYMDWLVDRVAEAAVRAYDDLRPATLRATQFFDPPNVPVSLSYTFPTTDDERRPVAIDPKIGVLQARRASNGAPIATVMSLAAHNQEIGHSGAYVHDVSADWPGYFHAALERRVGGMAMFLVGDNGSEEDPETVPPVTGPSKTCPDGCYEQAQASGEAFAAAVAAHLPETVRLHAGAIAFQRRAFCVPLENNIFRAAAVAGIFGERQTYTCPAGIAIPSGRVGGDVLTEASVVDVGPDLQLIANPGEAFPALMVGSPWGIEQASCDTRPNPPVPTWNARAEFRFQVGLANDLIGYLIPPWAHTELPGVFPTTCFLDPNTGEDPKGHKHKLETESVGYTAPLVVAQQLTAMLLTRPDPAARIRQGRFVLPDGTLVHSARDPAGKLPDAVAILAGNTLVALPGVESFGARKPDAVGTWMDYDGVAQGGPDVTTRGMLVRDRSHRAIARYYLDVYPAFAAASLPPARLRT